MAEEVLVSRPLLPSMISDGEELVDRLRRDGDPPEAAFWIHEPTSAGWKLVVASPDVNSMESFAIYKRVLDRAPQEPGLYWPALIRIEDSTHSLVVAVRAALKSAYGRSHRGWAAINLWSTTYDPAQVYVYVS